MRADAARVSPPANASRQSPASVLLSGPRAFISTGDLLRCCPIPLLPAPGSLFSIILIWGFRTLIWICVSQTSGGPPGSLLASTCCSAGSVCSRLRSGPPFRSWPDAHIRAAQAATPPSPASLPSQERLPRPPGTKKEQRLLCTDLCDQKSSWFYFRTKASQKHPIRKKNLRR